MRSYLVFIQCLEWSSPWHSYIIQINTCIFFIRSIILAAHLKKKKEYLRWGMQLCQGYDIKLLHKKTTRDHFVYAPSQWEMTLQRNVGRMQKMIPEQQLNLCLPWGINTLRLRQNLRHFTDDIFKCVLLNEYAWISFKISLKFIPKFRIYNIPALVQIMAWHWPGNKPLSGTNRYVDSTPTSEVTPVAIRYIRPFHPGHTSQYHGHG